MTAEERKIDQQKAKKRREQNMREWRVLRLTLEAWDDCGGRYQPQPHLKRSEIDSERFSRFKR